MSSLECPQASQLVEERIDRILTQYRESPKLLFLLRTYLNSISTTALQICNLPSFFDLDTAVGDQLTILGKRLGWPRCHCVCDVQPVFGFECEGVIEDYPIAGFCDEGVSWIDCGETGVGDVCIVDDELYRSFLKVRRYQMLGYFDFESLKTSLQIMFGDDANILEANKGRVVVTPGRELSNNEIALLQLYPRVLPIALGISVYFHFGSPKVFGFGTGWGGFCDYQGDEFELITYEDELEFITQGGDDLITGEIYQDAEWMCEFDVAPYSCG